ncbi:carbon-nitrogen hydrolase family protein [Halomonas sp. I5-271120]|uniref:carbon-nitrogen hydrolase family protein n=1 Tax=Halomonas sp. I5-271120 TaxID=3061632 RepID=UPI002714CAC9|nr:carbon-nitrogen hydrolase family protein [Halomonas sp. I5-271120]
MRIAIVQQPPVLLNREATLKLAVAAVEEASNHGADLVAFPEAFVPGYPIWIWRLRPGSDMALAETLHDRLLKNAVSLDGDDLAPLFDAARQHGVTVVCGISERDTDFSRATLYNSVVVIGPDGALINRHRKLMPTNPERMIWGFGDAAGLKVLDTPVGRIGTLVCWENYMPLARYALFAQGIEILISPTYDAGKKWLGTLEHIAREGGCWVVGCGLALRAADLPEDLPGRAELYPDPEEWINSGDSVVITPDGLIEVGPMHAEQGILYGEIDTSRVGLARRSLDVAGHYARPDVFQLKVNANRQSPVTFDHRQGEDDAAVDPLIGTP